MGAMKGLPGGTVTLLFTDVDGSTRLLDKLGPAAYAAALAQHRRVLREAFAAHGGVEVDTQGDSFFVAFPTAPAALAAAVKAQERLNEGPIRVRIGIHTGTPLVTDEGYVGIDVHRAARLAAAGSGGQIVVSASTKALVEGRLRDLGEHRFKDLAAAERVYQVGDESFPPLRSLPETNLPVPATPFFGRDDERQAVASLLSNEVRLLTLTGVGGTGKTRLALQAAADSADIFPGGVYWVPLAPLAAASLLVSSVIQAFGTSEVSDEQLPGVVFDRTGGRRALLLLDNCEHLLPEIAAPIAMLRDLPGISVVATSRERLRLQGEHVLAVPPLVERDAVRLFEAAARAAGAPPAPREDIRELCRRLDDLPLALELAAARSVLFSPAQLLERVGERLDLLKGSRDSHPRQSTLRATIEWSHDLLEERERQLFRRLAVFAGGCTYEAAEVVAEADPDTLQSLLDKSLIRRREEGSEPRYWMLETLHQFALEKLEVAREVDELRRRHLAFFLHFIESSRQSTDEYVRVLRPEHGNVRAAASFALQRGDAVSLGQLVWHLRVPWNIWGHRLEHDRWRTEVLRAEQSLPPLLRARMHLQAGWAAYRRREMVASRAHYQAAETLFRQLGETNGVALCKCGFADITAFEGDLEQARRQYEDVLDAARHADDVLVVVTALHELARILFEEGDYEGAHTLAAEQVRLTTAEAWYPSSRMLAVLTLALAELGLGNHDRALHLTTRTLADARDQGFTSVMWYSLLYLGEIAVACGEHEKAAALLSHAQTVAERFDFGGGRLEAKLPDRLTRGLTANLDLRTLAAAQNRGASMATDEAVILALSLDSDD
jgi:predicted ATPase/class 3 adenylate cyclase